MAEKNTIPLPDIFLISKEKFVTPNESSSFKNVAVYKKDADN